MLLFLKKYVRAMRLFNRSGEKSSPEISREDALRCTPVKNSSVQETFRDNGDVILEYPLHIKPFFLSLYKRFNNSFTPPMKKLQLDEMGTEVWKIIDNKKSTHSIIKTFAHRYNISLQEAEQSVTAFLLELGKRGLIGLR